VPVGPVWLAGFLCELMCKPFGDRSNLTAVEVVYFAREEMARKIADVLFRRTNIGWFGYPGSGFIEKCADIMGEELGWDSKRKWAEIDDAKRFFEDLQCRQLLR
jgi:glycerol-3-phosphate dehydrogenase